MRAANYDKTVPELVGKTYEFGEYAKQGLVDISDAEISRVRALNMGEVEITTVYNRPR
jgi:hypothetical protein